VVIGKDTRLSGYMLEPALTTGFTAMGMDVRLFGPLPTPGVAMLTRSLRADLGVMISASHNSYQDNGIKLFGPDGYKLSDEAELAIEGLMSRSLDDNLAASPDLGRAERVDDAQSRYIEIVKSTFPRKLRLTGLRVVIDCAKVLAVAAYVAAVMARRGLIDASAALGRRYAAAVAPIAPAVVVPPISHPAAVIAADLGALTCAQLRALTGCRRKLPKATGVWTWH
jgi:phosphoglucomutase